MPAKSSGRGARHRNGILAAPAAGYAVAAGLQRTALMLQQRGRGAAAAAAATVLCLLLLLLLEPSSAPPPDDSAHCEPPAPAEPMSTAQRRLYRESVRKIFTESFDAYMEHAFPSPELKPKSCTPGGFDPCELPMLTLVDAMDTLAVLGNDTQFALAVSTVSERANAPGFFDLDLKVNVFETTIRWLGGLLSAHCLATNGTATGRFRMPDYDGGLLTAAVALGDRLLPAFETQTGIPFGTVNLRHGSWNFEFVLFCIKND